MNNRQKREKLFYRKKKNYKNNRNKNKKPENLEKHRILASAKIKIEHHYRIRKKFTDNKNRNLNICNRFMFVGARVNLHKIENAP